MIPDEILNQLSIDEVWRHIEHICRAYPTRLAGTQNARRMAEYAYEQLAHAGVEGRLHEFPGLVSFPEAGQVRVLSPEAREIPGNTLGHSASTDGIEGELVYVGSGAESEYGDRDVRGKITLSELSYEPGRHEKAYIAWKRGSSAQVMMNWGDETNTAIPFGSMKSAWGNPTPETLETEIPDIPCIGISRVEGLRLKELCARGPVRVWLRTKAGSTWEDLTMTTGEFDARDGRQFLLIGGHMDSWPGPQATDNAVGSGVILELMKVFHRQRDRLRRGMVSGFWMGHETGTMISSTRFADTNWDRLRSSAVAYFQIDSPGLTGATVWRLNATDDIQNFMTRSTKEIVGDVPLRTTRMVKIGDASFFGLGLPSLAGRKSYTDEELKRTARANLGWWHHSIENDMDKLDKDGLAQHLRVYGNWVWGLLTEPILPLEYAPIATRFVDRLSQLETLNAPDIDMTSAVEVARDFQGLAERFDAIAAARRDRFRGSDEDEQAAGRLNQAMFQLSRTLVPVASTAAGAYGQDRYSHAWQSEFIPSLVPYERLASYPVGSPEFEIWWVAMIRARNRVVDALKQASDALRSVVSDLG